MTTKITNSGPYGWWRADVGTGSDGSNMTTWTDTINSRTFTTPAVDKPVWRTTNNASPFETRLTPNNSAVLDFSGSARPILTSLPNSYTHTVMLVVRYNWTLQELNFLAERRAVGGAPSGYKALQLSTLGAGSTGGVGGNIINSGYSFTAGLGHASSQEVQEWHILTIQWNSKSHVKFKINEEPEFIKDLTAVTDSGVLEDLVIGSHQTLTDNAQIYLASVLIWDRVLGESEQVDIRAALANLYGIRCTVKLKPTTDANKYCSIYVPEYVPYVRPRKFIVWCHGVGENRANPMLIPSFRPAAQALLNDGWLIACSDLYANNSWGNSNATTELSAIVSHLVDNYQCDTNKFIMLAHSMGNTNIVNYVRHESVKPRGIICSGNAVHNIDWAYDFNSSWTTQLNAAYGVSAKASIPSNRKPEVSVNGDYPLATDMRFSTSSNDTLVLKANNHDVFHSIVNAGGRNVSVFSTSEVDHGDATLYDPTRFVTWAGELIA